MFGDFVGELGASTGTGQYSMGGVVSGSCRTWRSEFGNNAIVGYLATTRNATKREVGWGTFTIGTPDKLTRNVVRSTSADGPVDWIEADQYRIWSVPLAFIFSALVNGGLSEELPGWAPAGWSRLGHGSTAVWPLLRYLGEGGESEEGRHHLAAGIFVASPRWLWVDKGPNSYTIAADDVGKVLLFDATAADRVPTLPAGSSVGHGFKVRVIAYTTGAVTHGLTLTPVGSDAIDRGAGGAPLKIPLYRDVTIEWDGAKSKWRTSYAVGPIAADAFRTTADNVNAQTGTSYTLIDADNGKTVTLSNGSAITLTVPAGLSPGFSCFIVQLGAGQITITPSSTTLRTRVGLKTSGQYAQGVLVYIAADTYSVGGDLTT